MELFLSAAGALALVTAAVNFVKNIRAGDLNGWLTQLVVWAAGIGTAALLAASDVANTFDLGNGLTLDNVNGATLILVGLGIGSTAMLANDFKKAIDSSDSAVKPDLVPPSHE